MSRHPVKALETADPIARQRGNVQYYERGAGMNADFTIKNPEENNPPTEWTIPLTENKTGAGTDGNTNGMI